MSGTSIKNKTVHFVSIIWLLMSAKHCDRDTEREVVYQLISYKLLLGKGLHDFIRLS